MSSICIFEDDLNLCEGLYLALRDTKSDLIQCLTFGDARVALAGTMPHLVILDMNLPGGSGLDLLREVKKSSHMPVILLTANGRKIPVNTGKADHMAHREILCHLDDAPAQLVCLSR